MPKTVRTAPSSQPESAEAGNPSFNDHVTLRMWVRLLGCYHLIETHLRTRFRDEFETTLPRFDLMSQLYRYPEGLRMKDLSRLLMVTGGNVTGVTDRLVEEGLIQRRDDPKDRRAYHVSLTPKGKKIFEKMAAEHEQWVANLLGDLGQGELQQLTELLDTLKKNLTSKSG